MYQYLINVYIYVASLSANAPTVLQFFMKQLYVLMSWPEDMEDTLDKILCFCFLFCDLKLFHDSSYIQRETKSGRGHKFSEFACS